MVPSYHPRDVGRRAPDGPAGGSDRRGGVKKKSVAPPDGEQPGSVQSRAWPGVPLSVQEIRRLLWRWVLALQQIAHHILAWSRWRRGHQAIAQDDHYKRRGVAMEAWAASSINYHCSISPRGCSLGGATAWPPSDDRLALYDQGCAEQTEEPLPKRFTVTDH